MIKYIGLFLLSTTLFVQQLFVPPPAGIVVKVKVQRIVDGDTIGVIVEKYFTVRFLDCWAPELKSKDPKEKELALAGKQFLIETLDKAEDISLSIPINEDISRSFTFGRLLGIVYAKIDGKWVNVNALMVEKGYATKTKE